MCAREHYGERGGGVNDVLFVQGSFLFIDDGRSKRREAQPRALAADSNASVREPRCSASTRPDSLLIKIRGTCTSNQNHIFVTHGCQRAELIRGT